MVVSLQAHFFVVIAGTSMKEKLNSGNENSVRTRIVCWWHSSHGLPFCKIHTGIFREQGGLSLQDCSAPSTVLGDDSSHCSLLGSLRFGTTWVARRDWKRVFVVAVQSKPIPSVLCHLE